VESKGSRQGGDDPTALVRVNFVGLKRPGTAAKSNNAKSVPAQYPISLSRADNRWSRSNHFYSEHVERPKPTGGAPMHWVELFSEWQPQRNAPIGERDSRRRQAGDFGTSKQDHPKTSTCFVRVFLSATFV
jgi:hypothetical protein